MPRAAPAGRSWRGRSAVPRYAVIGDPIAHSASPRMFGWLADRLGLILTYEAVRVSPEALAGFLEEARAGRWDGVSVTVPHKQNALVLADRSDPRAARTGAANCLVRGGDGRLVAHNTDVEGIVQALAHHGVSLAGHRRAAARLRRGSQGRGRRGAGGGRAPAVDRQPPPHAGARPGERIRRRGAAR